MAGDLLARNGPERRPAGPGYLFAGYPVFMSLGISWLFSMSPGAERICPLASSECLCLVVTLVSRAPISIQDCTGPDLLIAGGLPCKIGRQARRPPAAFGSWLEHFN